MAGVAIALILVLIAAAVAALVWLANQPGSGGENDFATAYGACAVLLAAAAGVLLVVLVALRC
jgi:hypothetical protein